MRILLIQKVHTYISGSLKLFIKSDKIIARLAIHPAIFLGLIQIIDSRLFEFNLKRMTSCLEVFGKQSIKPPLDKANSKIFLEKIMRWKSIPLIP